MAIVNSLPAKCFSTEVDYLSDVKIESTWAFNSTQVFTKDKSSMPLLLAVSIDFTIKGKASGSQLWDKNSLGIAVKWRAVLMPIFPKWILAEAISQSN